MNRFMAYAVSFLLISSSSLALAQDATPAAGAGTAPGDTTAAGAPSAPAPEMKGKHPRIKEVRERIQNQHKRIRAGVRSKKITKEQAQDLISKVKAVGEQMKSDIAQNGKKELTEDQLQQLNQMLDDNSKAIEAAENGGSTAAPAASDAGTTAPAGGDAGSTAPAASSTPAASN